MIMISMKKENLILLGLLFGKYLDIPILFLPKFSFHLIAGKLCNFCPNVGLVIPLLARLLLPTLATYYPKKVSIDSRNFDLLNVPLLGNSGTCV